MQNIEKTICAISSPSGVGAISIIRLSGSKSVEILAKIIDKGKKFINSKVGETLFCRILDKNANIIDEVLAVKYLSPKSFTGEDLVEIFCHGSSYIQSTIIDLLTAEGAVIAEPGEFTKRAFLNGKMDLSQSEAVADLISGSTAESHRIAMNQMRGNISNEINTLRERMLDLVALMELELDFSEEDVEFADRKQLQTLIQEILNKINGLIDSFKYGNAIKNGIPVAIVGEPNVGKSTLLNTLLQDDRAIVSSIAGTTRDTIEEELNIDGIKFRLIDTAGIRNAENEIEEHGIKRSLEKIDKAQLVLLLINAERPLSDSKSIIYEIESRISEDQKLIIVLNKADLIQDTEVDDEFKDYIKISAKNNTNINTLCNEMIKYVNSLKTSSNDIIITTARHLESLRATQESLLRASEAIANNISGDFISQDIREAMYFLGTITGSISTEEILGNIFSKFCIGK